MRSGWSSKRTAIACVAMSLAVIISACGGDDGADDASAPPSTDATATTGATTATTDTQPPANERLRILVTNDDGVAAPGIDALVEALRTIPDVQVTVSAPLTDQSGSGDRVSPDAPEGAAAKTASGRAAFAVPGTPADSVIWALDHKLRQRPHLVVSGVNKGQNVGPLAEVSGTVGAARTAARRGIAAVAVSQGLTDQPDFAGGARVARDWVTRHKRALLRSKVGTKPVKVVKIEVPTCAVGQKMRGTVVVPLATTIDGREPFEVSCASRATDPKDDIEALKEGFAPITLFDPELPSLQ